MDASPAAKKRKAHEAASLYSVPHPLVVALNVGGAPRTVRRSLLLQLRAASASHPLVDVLLSPEEHWSRVPTIEDADGTVRVYLDRDPRAFDDLLDYVEYGTPFIEELVRKEGGAGGARLERLRSEGDFFTVATLADDIEGAVRGRPVAFRADGWVSVAAQGNAQDGWGWNNWAGNEAVASKVVRGLGQCEVQRTGTYLLFFSLHSVAVTAMKPTQGYRSETNDEFCTLGVFHGKMTTIEGGDWTYPVVRCGAFDYREDSVSRGRNPFLVTASCAEPLALRKGNVLYAAHGTGVETPPETRQSGELVWQHSPQALKDSPQCVNYITLVAVHGDNVAKFNVDRMELANGEATTVPWNNESNYFPAPSGIPPLHPMLKVDKNKTRIEIKTSGHYLLLGRVAAKLRENYSFDELDDDWPTVQLELRTESGTPLHIIPDIVSYPKDSHERPYNEKLADYGHINDIVYAEKGSCIEVKAKNGACFAQHGSVPVSFEKLPTQNLSILRLKPSTRMDRYNISLCDNEFHFERALGGDELATEPAPLFAIDDGGDEGDLALKAVADCHCIVFGYMSSMSGHTATLLRDGTELIASQLSKEGGCGSHALNGVLTLKKDDCIHLITEGSHDINGDIACCGHLAFVALDS